MELFYHNSRSFTKTDAKFDEKNTIEKTGKDI